MKNHDVEEYINGEYNPELEKTNNTRKKIIASILTLTVLLSYYGLYSSNKRQERKNIKSSTQYEENLENQHATYYVAPKGYELALDDNGNPVAVKTEKIYVEPTVIEVNGKKIYSLPAGYVLTQDEQGNLIGMKIETSYVIPIATSENIEESHSRSLAKNH